MDYSSLYGEMGEALKQAFLQALNSFVTGLINYDYPAWLPLLLPIMFSFILIDIGVKTITNILDGIRPFSPNAFVHEYGERSYIDEEGEILMDYYDDVIEFDKYGYLPGDDDEDWNEVVFWGA